ncbi:MAG TPA: hypothetical protein VF978_03130 [Gemmatimonadales bacterium]
MPLASVVGVTGVMVELPAPCDRLTDLPGGTVVPQKFRPVTVTVEAVVPSASTEPGLADTLEVAASAGESDVTCSVAVPAVGLPELEVTLKPPML